MEIDDYFDIGGIHCEAFSIEHDAADPVGYNFYFQQYKIGYCTDIGEFTPAVREALAECDLLALESNHDIQMLKTGSYPEYLKKRILSRRGHLSNIEAGLALVKLKRKGKCQVLLAHISRENNTPEKAEKTVRQVLQEHSVCWVREVELKLTFPDVIASVEMPC
jgi:phosphoribosyl 1,2-cyclic phosphodiesterase